MWIRSHAVFDLADSPAWRIREGRRGRAPKQGRGRPPSYIQRSMCMRTYLLTHMHTQAMHMSLSHMHINIDVCILYRCVYTCIFTHTCIYVSMYARTDVCISMYMCVCIHIYPAVCLPIYPSIYPSIYLPTGMSFF